MKHFYIIANLDKEYVQEAQVFIKAYLEAKGAECLLHHTPERTRGAAHIDGAQVPEDTECVITIGGTVPSYRLPGTWRAATFPCWW